MTQKTKLNHHTLHQIEAHCFPSNVKSREPRHLLGPTQNKKPFSPSKEERVQKSVYLPFQQSVFKRVSARFSTKNHLCLLFPKPPTDLRMLNFGPAGKTWLVIVRAPYLANKDARLLSAFSRDTVARFATSLETRKSRLSPRLRHQTQQNAFCQ